MLETAEERIKL